MMSRLQGAAGTLAHMDGDRLIRDVDESGDKRPTYSVLFDIRFPGSGDDSEDDDYGRPRGIAIL